MYFLKYMACIFHNKPCVFFDVRKGIQKLPYRGLFFTIFVHNSAKFVPAFPGDLAHPAQDIFKLYIIYSRLET